MEKIKHFFVVFILLMQFLLSTSVCTASNSTSVQPLATTPTSYQSRSLLNLDPTQKNYNPTNNDTKCVDDGSVINFSLLNQNNTYVYGYVSGVHFNSIGIATGNNKSQYAANIPPNFAISCTKIKPDLTWQTQPW